MFSNVKELEKKIQALETTVNTLSDNMKWLQTHVDHKLSNKQEEQVPESTSECTKTRTNTLIDTLYCDVKVEYRLYPRSPTLEYYEITTSQAWGLKELALVFRKNKIPFKMELVDGVWKLTILTTEISSNIEDFISRLEGLLKNSERGISFGGNPSLRGTLLRKITLGDVVSLLEELYGVSLKVNHGNLWKFGVDVVYCNQEHLGTDKEPKYYGWLIFPDILDYLKNPPKGCIKVKGWSTMDYVLVPPKGGI